MPESYWESLPTPPQLEPVPTLRGHASSGSSPLAPEDRAATDGRMGSSRALRRAAGTRGELWWRWHFGARQGRGASRAGANGGFRRNFFSTYLSLIQASLSCLHQGRA